MTDPVDKKVDELLAELLKDKKPEEILGKGGVVKKLTKRLVEKALEGEMTAHLGYDKHAPEGRNTGNSRNGLSSKTIVTDTGELEIDVPRDRNASFEPELVPKRRRRLPGFDEKVIALYARGMTTREIQGHLHELYEVEVSPTLISTVTDAVLEDVKAWQARPLDGVYPVVYLDAIHVKLRTDGHVQVERATKPGRRGHPDRVYRWAARVSRGHREHLPQDPGPALYRPHDPQLAPLRFVEAPKDARS